MDKIIIRPGRHVLVIASAQDLQIILRLSLETATDLQVTTTSSLDMGIKLMHQISPDVILFDVTTLDDEQLYRLQATCAVPLICLVPRVRLSDQRQGQQRGVTEVLAKPFDPAQVAETVLTAIRTPHSPLFSTLSAA